MNLKLPATLLLALLVYLNSFSQKILVNGKESDGKLSWSDFTGKVDKGSSFYAYTAYKFNTKYGGVRFVGESALIDGFEIILELDQKNSWAKMDKVTDDLLVHEQGHFNLGMLCVYEIMNKFKEAKFTKANFSALLQSIVSEASKKYNDMGLKYDEETDHSKNIEQQKKWNQNFSEQMAK